MPPPFIVFIYLFICFEASSHYVSVTGLDLALQTRLASNSGTPCLCLRSLSQLSHIILLMRFLSFPALELEPRTPHVPGKCSATVLHQPA